MNVVFDTNIVLDFFLARQPFYKDARVLFARVGTGDLRAFLSATTVTTIFYLSAKAIGRKAALEKVRTLLKLFEVAPVHRPVLEDALDLGFSDYEDAVLHEAAVQVGAEAIVTRNAKDFARAKLRIYTPAELIAASGT